ncbi:hypothetical protein FXO38_24279 [Capsicum annuum]|nr:hypothetical protein FXO38_24279 [Capsicum annuum]KAF3640929.1 hypothetical protein FXO37_23249 [Capsicum annuum]
MVEANQGIENSSILEVGSSSKSDDSSSKGFEFVPLIDSSVVTMNLVDPLGDSKKSMKGMVESNHKTKTSSILEVASTLRSDNNISNGLKYLSFNDSFVLALMNSVNPYEDFKKSVEEMLEVNQQTKDCEKCLEELLIWYLKSNGKNNHSHSFTIPPFFGSTPGVSASPPFLSLLEAEDEIVDEKILCVIS